MMAGLHHLAFRTLDPAALAAFYTRWLGFSVRKDQGPHSIWLSLGTDCVLMLELRPSEEPGVPCGSNELVAFHIPENRREQVAAELVAEGMLEARTEHTLYFRDPDGRRIGLSSYPL
jgi:catechol 2,3-dioxygenase-like lactoylglutathione lyase family enzyme